ncbi:g6291 [Coccomyxa elongata]
MHTFSLARCFQSKGLPSPRGFLVTISSGLRPSRSTRLARIEDVAGLEEQAKATDWSLAQLEEEVNRSISTFLISEDRGAMQGFAVGWHVAGELQVMAIAVDEACRRRGIGQMLLEELLDISIRKGDTTAVLEVKASNQGALSLYSKLGFDQVGRRHRYYPNGEDALLLKRRV